MPPGSQPFSIRGLQLIMNMEQFVVEVLDRGVRQIGIIRGGMEGTTDARGWIGEITGGRDNSILPISGRAVRRTTQDT
jgi:hypothetical protein